MKYLILLVFTILGCIVTAQKDPGQVANDCKVKYPITAAEEQDIKDKKFTSTSANAKVC